MERDIQIYEAQGVLNKTNPNMQARLDLEYKMKQGKG